MIVSDDVSTCLYVEILAQQNGFDASYFTEPSVALRIFQNNPNNWSIVIIDMLSSFVMDFSLARKLKEVKPDLRLVMLATHVSEDGGKIIRRESFCGVCADEERHCDCVFLHKPFYRDFERVVRHAIGGGTVGFQV